MSPGGRAILVLLSVGAARPARAQQPAVWTLERVLAVALRQNADILTARLRVDSAHGEQQIARAIPNPVLNSAPNQPWQYTVTLPLDVTPLRFLRTRAAGRGADAARPPRAAPRGPGVLAVGPAVSHLLVGHAPRAARPQ